MIKPHALGYGAFSLVKSNLYMVFIDIFIKHILILTYLALTLHYHFKKR
jgi:hypothetical protein